MGASRLRPRQTGLDSLKMSPEAEYCYNRVGSGDGAVEPSSNRQRRRRVVSGRTKVDFQVEIQVGKREAATDKSLGFGAYEPW